MCKRLCKVPTLKLKASEWRTRTSVKASKYHWLILFAVTCAWAVWMAQDINGIFTGIEYTGSKQNSHAAIEISGVDFVSEEIKHKHQSLANSMRYQASVLSEDVLFGFQFSVMDRTVDDHIFFLCESGRIFGNAKVVHGSDKKIRCTEEYNGELKQVVRSKEVIIKAIDIEEWKQVEYTASSPKESCTIQHAIDVLELNWV